MLLKLLQIVLTTPILIIHLVLVRYFFCVFILFIFFVFFSELGREYMENRAEFNRKALEYVKKHALPPS